MTTFGAYFNSKNNCVWQADSYTVVFDANNAEANCTLDDRCFTHDRHSSFKIPLARSLNRISLSPAYKACTDMGSIDF